MMKRPASEQGPVRHRLIAYVRGRDLLKVKEEDAFAIDIINIASGAIRNGCCVWPEGEAEEVKAGLRRLRRINPELRLLLSVGGLAIGGFSETAATSAGRRRFAVTARELLHRYALDGIDIDWEYPGISVHGTAADPADREHFTLLLQVLRSVLDADVGRKETKLLTIAAGGDRFYCRNTEPDKAARYCDYIQLMTYDLRGPFTHATGHHTNLHVPRADYYDAAVSTAVDAFVSAGVPPHKIVIGAAFYSRQWKGVPDVMNGYNQFAETIGDYGPSYDELFEHYIGEAGTGKNGFRCYRDPEAKAPWLYDGKTFISYDDPESLQEKVMYLKERGLLGIMFWEYSGGRRQNLLRVLREALDAV